MVKQNLVGNVGWYPTISAVYGCLAVLCAVVPVLFRPGRPAGAPMPTWHTDGHVLGIASSGTTVHLAGSLPRPVPGA